MRTKYFGRKQLGQYIAYLAVNIKNSLIQAIEDAINWALSKLTGNKLGQWLGLDEKMRVNFNVSHDSADELKKKADSSFENIAPIFKETFNDLVSASVKVGDNVSKTLTNVSFSGSSLSSSRLFTLIFSRCIIINKKEQFILVWLFLYC